MTTPEDDDLRRRIAELPDPLPSAATDARIRALFTPGKQRRLPLTARLGIAAGILPLVFFAGWALGTQQQDEHTEKLHATRTLMLELMRGEDSHQRIRAATVSLSLREADPVVIERLGYLLRTDRSTNVRLAALDALQRFVDHPAARREMLAAMGQQPPPAVQAQLLEILVAVDEMEVLPHLEELIQNDTLPQRLRDAAQLGAFKLI